MLINAREAVFERVELLGKQGYFTELRVDRDTVPNGFYAYDLKEDGKGNICEVRNEVRVNHYGTVILIEELRGVEDGIQVSFSDIDFMDNDLVHLPVVKPNVK